MSIGRRVCWFALGAQLLLALFAAKQWLFVGTYRFYLDRRSESSSSIAPRASQRFDIVKGRVEPQILTTEDDRLAFPVAFPWRSQLEVRAVPVSPGLRGDRGRRARAAGHLGAPFPGGACRNRAAPASRDWPARARERGGAAVVGPARRAADGARPASGVVAGHGGSARPLAGKASGGVPARGGKGAWCLPGSLVRTHQRVGLPGHR